MKITKTEEKSRDTKIIHWFIDGIQIATCKVTTDWYCTIKNGAPSNIRTKFKTAKYTDWNREGLIQILNSNNFSIGRNEKFRMKEKVYDFLNSQPDTTWGNIGSILNKKSIEESINKFKEIKL